MFKKAGHKETQNLSSLWAVTQSLLWPIHTHNADATQLNSTAQPNWWTTRGLCIATWRHKANDVIALSNTVTTIELSCVVGVNWPLVHTWWGHQCRPA